MKTRNLLKLVMALSGTCAFAQVGIGTTSPNPSTQLEVVANDRGILIPNVALTSDTDNTTIANGNVESLLVYNTSTAGSLKTGYYYWADSKWNRLSTGEISAIADNLTSTSTTEPLSANQGRVLKELIDVNTAKVGLTPAQQTLLGNTSGANTGDQDISGIATNTTAIATKLDQTANFGGDVSGTYNAIAIAADAVTTAKIADGTIAAADLANDAVTPLKVAAAIAGTGLSRDAGTGVISVDGTAITGDGNITSTNNTIDVGGSTNALLGDVSLDVAAGAIATDKIAADAVTNPKIAADAVQANSIADDAVREEHIADDAVREANILDRSVTSQKLGRMGGDGSSDGYVLTYHSTIGVDTWQAKPLPATSYLYTDTFEETSATATTHTLSKTAVLLNTANPKRSLQVTLNGTVLPDAAYTYDSATKSLVILVDVEQYDVVTATYATNDQ